MIWGIIAISTIMHSVRLESVMSVIELDNLRKKFGSLVAVDGLNLTVEGGEVYGYLGPNGAGKSTTIDLLLNYLQPTDGTVSVFGMDAQRNPTDVRRKTGILPEGFSPMKETTGREHVEFAISARSADDDPAEILELVGLSADADRNATDYSKGMLQRMALGMALVGDPELLILDEPSGGLDPYGVRLMREIVHEERDRGAAVFFSSHLLEQVEAVADRVGIINEGELVAVDTIDGLREDIGRAGQLSVTLDSPASEVESEVRTLEAVSVEACTGDTITVSCPANRKIAVIDAVRRSGAEIRDFETRKASLEELFVARTEARA